MKKSAGPVWREAGAASECGGRGVWGPSETEADSHSQDSGHHRAERRGLMWPPGPPATGRTWFCASDQWQPPILSPEGAAPASSRPTEQSMCLRPSCVPSHPLSLRSHPSALPPPGTHPFPLCLSSSCPLSLRAPTAGILKRAPHSRHPQAPQTFPHARQPARTKYHPLILGGRGGDEIKNVWWPRRQQPEQVRVGTDQGRTGEGMQVRFHI